MTYIDNRTLCKAEFIKRINRFVVIVNYNREFIKCHLPNPGRMKELLLPNSSVLINFTKNTERKTKATLIAIEHDGEIIQLDTTLFSKLISHEWKNIPSSYLKNYQIERAEYTMGSVRFDFLLTHKLSKQECILEVKSTTLVRENIACFPDAVSIRASKHLDHLIKLKKNKYEVGILFLIFRKAKEFSSCSDIDEKFSIKLKLAKKSGVKIIALQVKTGITEINEKLYLKLDLINELDISI